VVQRLLNQVPINNIISLWACHTGPVAKWGLEGSSREVDTVVAKGVWKRFVGK